HVSAMNAGEVIQELVDEEAILVAQPGQHAGAFHSYRLIKKSDDEERGGERKKHVAPPQPKTASWLFFYRHQLQPGLPKGHRIRCFRIGCFWLAGVICACPLGWSLPTSWDCCRTSGRCKTISTDVPGGITISLPRVNRV